MSKNETAVYLCLREIGVPRSVKGYTYIKEALMMMLEVDKPYALKVTKILYPQIAKKFNANYTEVER